MDARMPLINLKYRLEYGVVRTVAWLVGRLPLETASDLSGRIWRWIAPFLGRHDRAMAHLAAAFPDMSFTLNGGVHSLEAVHTHLEGPGGPKGVMVGREAYRNPWYKSPAAALSAMRDDAFAG
jgi:hypothetical protein